MGDGACIETERLILRPLRIADLGPLHEVYADREVMRHVDDHSETVDDSERRLQRLIEHQERHGFSLWAVTDRDSGGVLGDAGLILLGHRGPEIELGYRLARPYWGKGYATEAAAAWLAYGFDELGLERIVAVTRPENVASQRVLEKIGMRLAGPTTYGGEESLLFALDRGQRATA